VVSHETRKDDEGVYGEYTPRRTDAVVAETTQVQEEREFCNHLIKITMGKIITALDIGTSTIHTIIAERRKREEGLRILGVGVSPSLGVRRGAIVDIEVLILKGHRRRSGVRSTTQRGRVVFR